MKQILLATTSLLLIGSALAQTKTLTVYSGRGKGLVDPIVQQFEIDTGIKVNVRYGTDAALLAALQEEGARTPADLFWSNTSGALGTAVQSKLLLTLPENITSKVPATFTPEARGWAPLTIRFRTLAYNTGKLKPEQLPASVMDLPKMTQLKGRIGWTPTYSSFQDFIGAMIALKGEQATREWIAGMKALEPKSYAASNVAMMEAIRGGEIDLGLTNHYYIQRFVKSGAPIGTHYFAAGDPGSLSLVTGVGVLKNTRNMPDALKLVRYLLDSKAQQFFTGELFEYPVSGNTILPTTLLPFQDAMNRSPRIDQEKLGVRLEPALKLLREAGLL
ncbi:iron ABC transporter substrate-binding protein [Deinococcus peraridilitoris]|uniref:ABC-type Fe3+ transport system, periplasmic component n=1 Tax=Deinococcus peraridilitoris (strain DSM 19664 / LMG 22246 / CIP 109416 / KR-200) TaxID=937777 RepID=K9ZYP4_DEIPD|nr:iron ABC transporter substrate-binding protein [Deinococcus peraridilitoris]AFZ66324.1 ABC-type Fe3+ transport system, periplasmic component [Deinococcus peraridilitoris DSM 19664]